VEVLLPRPTGLPFAEFGNRNTRLAKQGRREATSIWFASHFLIVSLLVPMSHAATVYPASGASDSHDSLSCSGGLVVLGDSKSTVREKCGPPQNVDKGCVREVRHGSLWCWNIWMYRPNTGYFPRYVGFVSDTVTSIQTGSRFE
jgi:hypothetical protein